MNLAVFLKNTLTPVSSTGQALALSHDGRGDESACVAVYRIFKLETEVQIAHGVIMASTSPRDTFAPMSNGSARTVPATGDGREFCIFMASSTTTGCPALDRRHRLLPHAEGQGRASAPRRSTHRAGRRLDLRRPERGAGDAEVPVSTCLSVADGPEETGSTSTKNASPST